MYENTAGKQNTQIFYHSHQGPFISPRPSSRRECSGKLTMSVLQTVPDIFEQAKLSHAFSPQNAQELMESFCISKSQAKEIIQACPDCQLVQPPASMGAVNPRGLQSLQLWQTDVTNIHLLESSRTFMFQLTLSQEQSLHHYRQGKPHSMPVDIFCKPLYY